jgi:hypothetical protein
MMTRTIPLMLLGFVLMVCGGLACTSKSAAPPVPTAHGYTFSLRASDTNLWLGSQSIGDPRPGNAELIVEVRDAQGHRVEGVPVAFRVAPSWVQSATLMPQDTLTSDGTARAVLKPHTTGVVTIMAQVNGQTQAKAITVEARNFGNNSGR